MSTMRAVIQDRYGAPESLRVGRLARPEPGDGEVRVRVRASSVHADVWHVIMGVPYVLRLMGAGLRRPTNPVPGTDLAGVVDAVGGNVTQLAVGDPVYGETVAGFQWQNGGAYAEHAVVEAKALAPKPERLSFAQAAAIPTPGLIALRNLGYGGGLRRGSRVLINGAGGAVGSFAVQMAKAAGAEVTAVDCAAKLDLLRDLGADRVVDYEREEVASGSARYDLILDVASTLTLAQCRPILTARGKYVLIGHDHFGRRGRRWLGSIPHALGLTARGYFDRHLPRAKLDLSNDRLWPQLVQRVEQGDVMPVIDRTFGLDEVPEALRYLTEGNPAGRVIVVP